MTWDAPVELQAAVLGAVQGLTEFFPISSSAHLVVLPELLGWRYLGKGFDVALHIGTLLALVEAYRCDLRELGRGAQRLVFRAGRAEDPTARLVRNLIVGCVPAAIAGLLLEDLVEPYLQGLLPIALLSILWGALLGFTDLRCWKRGRPCESLGSSEALIIGCAQACALLPGTSRSGVTTMAGLELGMDRVQAVRFSLLLSIPVVAGAALLKSLSPSPPSGGAGTLALLIGIGSSWTVGRFCLAHLLRHLESGTFRPFAIYRMGFGAALLLWLWMGP